MENQVSQVETASKLSRSAARRLRRKRLHIARHQQSCNTCDSEFTPEQSISSFANDETSSVVEPNQSKLSQPKLTSQIGLVNQSCNNQNMDTKKSDLSIPKHGNTDEKSKESIKIEREAKKAAKAAAKLKIKMKNDTEKQNSINFNIHNDENKNISKGTTDLGPKTQQNSIQATKSTDDVDFIAVSNAFSRMALDSKKSRTEELVIKEEQKSKAELRAERRAKQEAQRAAKQGNKLESKKESQPVKIEKLSEKKISENKEEIKKIVKKPEPKDAPHEVKLFKHLYLERKLIIQQMSKNNINVHPAILRLGVQYAEKIVVGSNARCVALLAAVKKLIDDYVCPSQADFTRGLETNLQEAVNYLNFCRPIAVSMQNALRHLKWQMSALPANISDERAKTTLINAIDTYIKEQILLADDAISETIQKKISEGDVILTYGFSSLIQKILCDAHDNEKQFRVIVVDGRPLLEGKELLRRLVKHGLDCSYVLINSLSYIMPQVSKVFLGAHAILANGAVMSRVGTSQVALMAKAFNVPVLVACEMHKSCELVQTDSIVYNEIGDPDQLVKSVLIDSKKSCLANWRSRKTLKLLNITYDVTPADLVTAVVTELAILPCTSVPVILRIKPPEL